MARSGAAARFIFVLLNAPWRVPTDMMINAINARNGEKHTFSLPHVGRGHVDLARLATNRLAATRHGGHEPERRRAWGLSSIAWDRPPPNGGPLASLQSTLQAMPPGRPGWGW